MIESRSFQLSTLALFAALAACGGGGGGGGGSTSGGGSVIPTPTPTAAPQTVTASATQPTTAPIPATGGYSGTITIPTGSGTATIADSTSTPSGTPVLSIVKGAKVRTVVASNNTPLLYFVVTAQTAVTLSGVPGFTVNVPAGITGSVYIAALENGVWTTVEGPATIASGTAAFAPGNGVVTIAAGQSAYFCLYQGGTVPTPTPSPTPTATPTATPTPSAGNEPALAGPPYTPNLGWAPTSVANQLNFPVQSGYNGTGQTVAIIMDAYPAAGDLSTYFAEMLTARTGTIANVDVDGGTSAVDSGEATLDTETVAGLAPGANVRIYGIPSLNTQQIDDAISSVVSDNLATVINLSAGGCEYPDMSATDSVIAQAASAGIAFVASSGDEGNECAETATTNQVGVNFPASDPNAIGVGGNETERTGHQLTDIEVWNDNSCSSGQCAGGGGVSQYFALPAVQSGLAGIASQTNRNVPDVTLPAESVGVYVGGRWALFNGTSWAAPIYSAMLAQVYEYCRSSFQDPIQVPYYVYAHNSAAFIDVVAGDDQLGATTPFYAAGAGYDDASGLGIPLGMPFAQTICPNRVPALGVRRVSAAIARSVQQSGATTVRALRLNALADLGRRNPQAATRIQLTLAPTDAAANETHAIAALRAAGFTIVRTFGAHTVIDAQAPSSLVEQTFATELHDLAQGRYGARYAPVRDATIPQALAPYVSAAVLDNVVTLSVPH